VLSQVTLSKSGLERLHAAMETRVERGELPGLSMLIARDDDVHVDAIGMKAFGSNEPMQADTLFRIASMTKPVVAAAALMLVEDGRIGLGDAIDRWLPELANRRVLTRIDGPLEETVPATRPITLEDLLTSRMGFGMLFEPTPDPPFPIVQVANELQLTLGQPDPRTPHTPDEWIRRFGTLPLMYQPGERWQYNAPFLVLGVLLARVAEQPLGDLLANRIFQALGMTSTGFSLPLERTRDLPAYYMTNFATNELEELPVSTADEWSCPPAFPSAAGGLLSTLDDYLRFARFLLNRGEFGGRRLLSGASVDAMTTNALSESQIAEGGPVLGGNGWGYGLGVVTRTDPAWPVPGRYGWAGGYGTDWFNDPHTGTIAIVMTQVSPFMWNGGMDEFVRLVAAV
jgi:CubicO group peptidase (beta-lactamase class C family)